MLCFVVVVAHGRHLVANDGWVGAVRAVRPDPPPIYRKPNWKRFVGFGKRRFRADVRFLSSIFGKAKRKRMIVTENYDKR